MTHGGKLYQEQKCKVHRLRNGVYHRGRARLIGAASVVTHDIPAVRHRCTGALQAGAVPLPNNISSRRTARMLDTAEVQIGKWSVMRNTYQWDISFWHASV